MNLRPQQPVPQSGLQKMAADAGKFWSSGNYPEVIQIFERASKLYPDNDKLLVDLGLAYVTIYDFAAAERCYARAVDLSPTKTEALMTVGQHWMDIRRFESAKDCFERVLQQSYVPIAAYIRLSELYIRMRRMPDAVEAAERALKMDSNHGGAQVARAKVHRQMKEFDRAEALLRCVFSKTDQEIDTRASAGYELGILLDQQGRFDEAMSVFVATKALMHPTGSIMNTLRLKQGRMKEMGQTATAALFQRWRKFGQTDLQPPRKLALLCGHARSGTTLLEYVLDSHPQIVSADETSVFQAKAYFSITSQLSTKTQILSVIDSLSSRTIRNIRGEYFRGIESFVGQSIGDRLLVDKNPALMFDIPSLVRFFPETKFLVALRDPRDVCLSCFMQATPVLPDTVPWLTLEGTINYYADVMGLWLKLKPYIGDAAIEVRYEEMVQGLEPVARRTLDFLGLPWDERLMKFNEHAEKKVVRSPTFVEVAKPVYKTAMGRWNNYRKYFEPYLDKFAPFLQAFGYEG